MRKILLLSSFIIFAISLSAQSVREDMRRDILCLASNYRAYPTPEQKKLTPAPKGMKPFYISHYGRHGSRFHTKPSMYNAPFRTLQKADSLVQGPCGNRCPQYQRRTLCAFHGEHADATVTSQPPIKHTPRCHPPRCRLHELPRQTSICIEKQQGLGKPI